MANPKAKPLAGKDPGYMDEAPDLLEATRQMDLAWIEYCLQKKPASVDDTDDFGNNAMHLLVAGGASIRARELIEFFLMHTAVNLLHENYNGLDPLGLAIVLNDEDVCQMIEPRWNDQLHRIYPPDDDLPPLAASRKNNGPNGPSSGPT
jgi:hypothetical protein